MIERGGAEVLRYGATIRHGLVSAVRRSGADFDLVVDRDEVRARHLLVATGVRDELPRVVGVPEQWGRGVVVCPYCDGWESRDTRVGILGTGPRSVEQAQVLRQWSPDVVLLTNGVVVLSGVDRVALAARDIGVDERLVERVDERGGTLTLQLQGGRIELDRIFTVPRAVPNDLFPRMVGVEFDGEPTRPPVRVSGYGATTVEGVWAAGNIVDPSLKVQSAAGAGMAAGAELNESLVRRDVRAAISCRSPGTRGGPG